MKVEVFSDINDTKLKAIWKDLESKSHCFPQSGWAWCSSWWNYFGHGRKVRIYVVYDKDEGAIAVAPFIIDCIFGIKFLRSMPENYGDYFSFVISENENSDLCYSLVFEEVTKSNKWHGVLLFNVNSRSELSDWILRSSYQVNSKLLVKTIFMNLGSDTYAEYLQKLSKNRRGYIRKKQRSLEQKYKIEVSLSTSVDSYLSVFKETFDVQKMRWHVSRPKRSDKYINLVKETNSYLFQSGLMAILCIRANGRLISYRIGFIHKNCYYDWNTSYDPQFEDYSPGAISIAYMVDKLIDIGISKIDFMAGFYDYKLSYSPEPKVFENRLYVFSQPTLRGRFLSWYYLHGRDIAKNAYHRIKQFRVGFLNNHVR